MNFHTDIYKCIAHDRLEKIKKETYEKHCYYNKKADSIEWKMINILFLSPILRIWKA
ncbi:hypothetical protein ACDX78_20935 [Virgibacillus oceani]